MTKFLIIGLSTVILILLAFYITRGLSAPKKGVAPLPVLVAPSHSPRATFNPFAKMPQPTPTNLKPLQVISVEPKEDLTLGYNPVTQIKLTFSDDIDLDNFLLEITPNTQISIKPDTISHTYTISPKTFWPTGITTITIKSGTKSLQGAILDNTFTYKINIQYPKNPPDDTAL